MAHDRTFTVSEDDDGIRLDRWFKRHQADVSFNLVSRWARTGQLRVDGKRAEPGDRIASGQEIRIPPAEAQPARATKPQRRREPLTEAEVQLVRSMVIQESADAFVLNKPPGLATQGGTKTTQHLDRLLDGLADDEGHRPKLVHRLDKDTSGAILVARNARAAGLFSKAFSSRTAKKVYWALVVDVPAGEEGVIELPLSKQPGTGGEKMQVDDVNGQPAKTRWRIIERAGNRVAWVELQPLTGRTHQLRVHMAAIGHPIVGDGKYGGPDAYLTGGISRKLHLHARRLRIDAPGGKIDVTAELPDHFAQSLDTLGFEIALGDHLPPRKAEGTPLSPRKPKPQARRGAGRIKPARGGNRAR
ncbi:RluA family pseudouridine synthase [Sphingomonas sinipercae]|uniref:RluA family pseudouridine synthase n=1 Tax=Sphingomonas sinipercae TaxID=2714944 RepID=A0A6G7ZM02_9SPHN|nr:RluA family pseudouridine synthase [Sphingomonas sinipercae]QIL01926.1 RluA family pseudouridine synthase [Sphingomonas sinipercae]